MAIKNNECGHMKNMFYAKVAYFTSEEEELWVGNIK